ncbi:MAG: serine/threonine-protein kinase RsbW [Thermoleophilaceae bacterium]|jgi:two-component sensor histidine kinase|nr:serine/threonine-protein kinase RsbW [Thermoleophilaceae bacterium]
MANPTPSARVKPSDDWQRDRALRLTTVGGPHAPERVRVWLETRAGWLPDEVESNLMLLTCELVNNSVLHGQAGEQDVIEVELRTTETGLRAQVSDPGRGFAPAERDKDIDEPGGWGLVLVERLAERWGIERDDRTRVWFELAAA